MEADRIAAGVTGYTTAKLTAQHPLIYTHLRKAFGLLLTRLAPRRELVVAAAIPAAADPDGMYLTPRPTPDRCASPRTATGSGC